MPIYKCDFEEYYPMIIEAKEIERSDSSLGAYEITVPEIVMKRYLKARRAYDRASKELWDVVRQTKEG